MEQILLVQPRHSYAPLEGVGHICTPTSLWTAGRILEEADADVRYDDANLHPVHLDAHRIIGVNLLGAPYIPVVREAMKEVLVDPDRRVILGGQVVEGLTTDVQLDHRGKRIVTRTRADLVQLFGPQVVNGSLTSEVAQATGLDLHALEEAQQRQASLSLVPVYKKISDKDMRLYLKNEMSFYLSQGCKYACDFCAAPKRRPERYRDADVLKEDLTYLTERARHLKLSQLTMYLSNLDLFQNPAALRGFLSIIQDLSASYPGFTYAFRGLACDRSVVQAHKKDPALLGDLKDAGLTRVGFGVDGADEKVWKGIRKGQNNLHEILQAMQLCAEHGIVPENIMVFGHPNETEKTVKKAYTLTRELQDTFGAVPRPHVAKDLIPGNDYWTGTEKKTTALQRAERRRRKAFLLRHPQFFQALDFKALPSSISHPDPLQRASIERYYLDISAIADGLQSIIWPEAPEFDDIRRALHALWNSHRYDN